MEQVVTRWILLIRRPSTVSKEHWKGDVQLRWTSSWINIRQVILITSSSELVWPHQVNYHGGCLQEFKFKGKLDNQGWAIHGLIQSAKPSAIPTGWLALLWETTHSQRTDLALSRCQLGRPLPITSHAHTCHRSRSNRCEYLMIQMTLPVLASWCNQSLSDLLMSVRRRQIHSIRTVLNPHTSSLLRRAGKCLHKSQRCCQRETARCHCKFRSIRNVQAVILV